MAPTRAADRRNGACRGLASQPGCQVGCCARSPTGTEDGKLRDAAGASVVDVFFVQFIDGVDVPVIMQRRGLLSVLGQGHCMPVVSNDRWSMPLFMQFFDGCGRRCDHAATSGLSLEVPLTQFIARVRGHSSCTAETVTMLSSGWR